MSEIDASPATSVIATLAYLNMCTAELVMAYDAGGLTERCDRARLGADALARYRDLSDAMPGGYGAAVGAIGEIASPIDEFLAMTAPRDEAAHLVRLAGMAAWELELWSLIAAEGDNDIPIVWKRWDDVVARLAGLIVDAEIRDAASLFARRVIGEATVMSQRIIVRHEGFRRGLTGHDDESLMESGHAIDQVLQTMSSRLAGIGLQI